MDDNGTEETTGTYWVGVAIGGFSYLTEGIQVPKEDLETVGILDDLWGVQQTTGDGRVPREELKQQKIPSDLDAAIQPYTEFQAEQERYKDEMSPALKELTLEYVVQKALAEDPSSLKWYVDDDRLREAITTASEDESEVIRQWFSNTEKMAVEYLDLQSLASDSEVLYAPSQEGLEETYNERIITELLRARER